MCRPQNLGDLQPSRALALEIQNTFDFSRLRVRRPHRPHLPLRRHPKVQGCSTALRSIRGRGRDLTLSPSVYNPKDSTRLIMIWPIGRIASCCLAKGWATDYSRQLLAATATKRRRPPEWRGRSPLLSGRSGFCARPLTPGHDRPLRGPVVWQSAARGSRPPDRTARIGNAAAGDKSQGTAERSRDLSISRSPLIDTLRRSSRAPSTAGRCLEVPPTSCALLLGDLSHAGSTAIAAPHHLGRRHSSAPYSPAVSALDWLTARGQQHRHLLAERSSRPWLRPRSRRRCRRRRAGPVPARLRPTNR